MTGPTPRPGILDIAPYVPGESSVPFDGPLIKLSSNESALGPSPRAVKAFQDSAPEMYRYPDGASTELRRKVGSVHGLDPERIVMGLGSDEILYMVARAYVGPGDEVIHTEHGFVLYPIVIRTVGATPVSAPEKNLTTDVDAILSKVTDRTRLVFVANPNNPTGSYIPAGEMKRLRDGLRDDIVLVIDCAYAEYVTREDYSVGVELVDAADNTIMTRTFSKAYGLGGLRLGWGYMPPMMADVLNRIRDPFNVSLGAQAAGIAALEDQEFVAKAREHNAIWLPWITDQIHEAGLIVHPSIANFVLVEFPSDGPKNVKAGEQFLNRRGIIPRNVGGAGLPNCLRISIGLEHEMRAVADAIRDFMAS